MFEWDPDPDTGHTQRQNARLREFRTHEELVAANLRAPKLTEGCAFTESLVDADVFGIGYMPRKTYF